MAWMTWARERGVPRRKLRLRELFGASVSGEQLCGAQRSERNQSPLRNSRRERVFAGEFAVAGKRRHPVAHDFPTGIFSAVRARRFRGRFQHGISEPRRLDASGRAVRHLRKFRLRRGGTLPHRPGPAGEQRHRATAIVRRAQISIHAAGHGLFAGQTIQSGRWRFVRNITIKDMANPTYRFNEKQESDREPRLSS